MRNVVQLVSARPLSEWHDDDGCVLWWRCPVNEPPWVGSPLDDDWVEDYYTHWTPIEVPQVDYHLERYQHAVTQDYSRWLARQAGMIIHPTKAHWQALCQSISATTGGFQLIRGTNVDLLDDGTTRFIIRT